MKNKKGFTLAEVLVAVVVIVIALVPLIMVIGQGAKRGKDPQKIAVANLLAQDLMEEIICKSFDEDPTNPTSSANLGPERNESRSGAPTTRNYDDVDDYDGYTETPPKEVDGTVMTDYTGYTRSVVVEYVSETNLDTVSTAITRYKRITVTVSWTSGGTAQSTVLRAIKGNY